MLKAIEMAHKVLEEVIFPGDAVVDATMGNGYDTLFLANLGAEVFAFDVQKAALKATEKRLSDAHQSAHLILDGHEKLDEYVKVPIKAGIFNLGYLPNADKTVITKPETTLTALSKLTELLVPGGRIALMVYYGHEGGAEEKNAVVEWVKALPQQEWEVMCYAPINQIHTPPIFLGLEKRKGNQ